jgi:hypothetical protein
MLANCIEEAEVHDKVLRWREYFTNFFDQLSIFL